MLKPANKHVSAETYFAQEKTGENRSEYYHGDVFAMAGGTPNHNRITLNLANLVNAQQDAGQCEAFASDLRVQVDKDRHYAYPDIVVVCGEPELAQGRSDTLVNPVAIIEVLSESTKDYDRGSKFTAYRGIKSLTDYMLVDQNSMHVEYFSKENDGSWRLREYFDPDETVSIRSVNAKASVKEIYKRVVFAEK